MLGVCKPLYHAAVSCRGRLLTNLDFFKVASGCIGMEDANAAVVALSKQSRMSFLGGRGFRIFHGPLNIARPI